MFKTAAREALTHTEHLHQVDPLPEHQAVISHPIPVLKEDSIQHEILPAIRCIQQQHHILLLTTILPFHIDPKPMQRPRATHHHAILRPHNDRLPILLNADAPSLNAEALRLVCMEMHGRTAIGIRYFIMVVIVVVVVVVVVIVGGRSFGRDS